MKRELMNDFSITHEKSIHKVFFLITQLKIHTFLSATAD